MTLDTLKSANRVIGIKQVSKAVKRESAACVFIADDADERVTAPLLPISKHKPHILCIHEELVFASSSFSVIIHYLSSF